MKLKIFSIALLGIVALGMQVESASAFGRKWVTRITCKPYNAFSAACYGRMTCVGCCPSLFAPQPSCPQPCCPPMHMHPPHCVDGSCGAPAYVHHAPPEPHHQPNSEEPPSFTPPSPTPVTQHYAPRRIPYSVQTTAHQRSGYGYAPTGYPQQPNYHPGYYQPYPVAPMQQMPAAPTMPVPYYWNATPNAYGY